MWLICQDDEATCPEGSHRFRRVALAACGRHWACAWPGGHGLISTPSPGATAMRSAKTEDGATQRDDVRAPMAARVLAVHVAPGDAVSPHQPLVVLEAMKMEHTVLAQHSRTVERVAIHVGEQVSQHQLLIDYRPRGEK